MLQMIIIAIWCNVCQNTGSKKASLGQKKFEKSNYVGRDGVIFQTLALFSVCSRSVALSVIFSIIFNYVKRQHQKYIENIYWARQHDSLMLALFSPLFE